MGKLKHTHTLKQLTRYTSIRIVFRKNYNVHYSKKKLRRKLEESRAYLRRRNQSKAFKVTVILAAEFALVAALWGIVTFSNVHLEWPLRLSILGRPAVEEEYEVPAALTAEETDEEKETTVNE